MTYLKAVLLPWYCNDFVYTDPYILFIMKTNYLFPTRSLKTLLVLLACLFLTPEKTTAQSLNFTAGTVSGCTPLNVQFTCSQASQSYLWDFGDGATSILQNPSHVYINPGSYSVKLTTDNDSLVRTNYITVLADPVANFQVSNSSVCQNSTIVSFTNTSQNASNFIWDFGDGTTSNDANPSHLYTNSGNYTVQLIASNSFGCNDLKVQTNAVQVLPQPAVDFSASSTTLCIPLNQTTFTNLTPSVASQTWIFGDGSASSTATNPSHTYAAQGSYHVTLICVSTNGCTDTLTKNSYITVVPMSTSTISADTTTGCLPLTVHFTTSPGTSYLWNFGNGATSTAADPAFTYTLAGNYNVSVTITKPNGCVETAQSANLISIPDAATALFSVDATSGCTPLPVHFTNLSTNAASYSWNFGDGQNSTATNPNHTYVNNASNTVILKAYNSAGCPSSYTYTTAIVSSHPFAAFNIPQFSNCAPFSVPFNNISNQGAINYLWNFGDGSTSTLYAPTHTYTSPGSFTVSLIAYNAAGCSDTLVRDGYVTVINPTVNYTSVDTLVGCAPYNVAMSDSTFGASSWLWNFGDGTQSTLRNATHTYSQSGIYTITLNIALNGGCTQFYPVFKRVKVSEVNAGFNYTYNCITQTISFYDTTANVASNTWNFCDGTTSTLLNPLHTYPASGAYNISLSVTNTDGCSEMLSFVNLLHVALCPGVTIPSDGIVPPSNGQQNQGGGTSSSTSPPDNKIHGCAPLDVNFSYPLSSGTFVRWEFGDNSSSTTQSVGHTYSNAGVYTVKLFYNKASGVPDTIVYNNLITISKPDAAFNITLNSNCTQYSVSTSNTSVNANQFSWSFGDGVTSNSTNPTHTYAGNEIDYTISLHATDTVSGCTSQQANSIFLSNNNLIWANKYNGCATVPILFYSSASYQSYTWDFGDGTTANTQSPSHAFTAPGTYTVTLSVVDGFGCTHVFNLPHPISISKPVADFSYARTGNCTNFEINFINQSLPTNLGTGGSCLWTFGDGHTSAQYTPIVTHTYAHPGTYTVQLTLLTGGGCVNIISKTVEVGLLEAAFTMHQNRNCFPMNLTFTDQTIGATGWDWSFGNGQSSTSQNPVATFTQLPTDSVRLIVTDNRGCKDTLYKKGFHIFSNSMQVSVDSTCVHVPVAFTSLQDSISVNWNFGDGTTSTALNPQHAYTSANTFTVQMVSTDMNGCVSSADTTIYTSAPVTNFASADTVGCAPKFVHFTNASLGSQTYSWNFGDGSGSTNANPSHIYNTPGVYNVKLISFSPLGCSDTLVRPHYVRVIGPVVSFTLTDDTICVSNGIGMQLQANNVASWQWNFGDGATSTDTTVSHIYTTPGHFMVTVIAHDTHGCSSFFADSSLFVSANPVAAYAVDTLLHCAPVSVHFNNASTGASSYAWTFGNSNTSSAVHPPMQSYTTAGTFVSSLIVYNSIGCSDTAKKSIQILQAPVTSFHASNTAMCPGTSFSLINTSTDTLAPHYNWIITPNYVSSAANPTVTLNSSGSQHDVTLIATNSNGCTDTLVMPNYITIADSLAPAANPIKVVSVSSDTSILIKWEQASCTDFKAYILYKKNNSTGGFSAIDTITDITTTQYTDRWLNTLHHTYTYKLQTMDICENAISLNELTAHRSIEITAQVQTGNAIKVTWNAYEGCTVSGYKIERMESGGAFAEVATVPAGQTWCIDSTAYCPVKFIYRISGQQVCGTDETAYSDTSTARPGNNFLNQKVNVIRSTVVDNSSVLTEWAPPVVLPNSVQGYKIYRKTGNHVYSFVANVPAVLTSYVDTDVDVNAGTYEYKILVVNYCNMTTGEGDEGESILLEVQQHDLETELKWTPYTKWGTGVEKYIIERKRPDGQWEQVKTVNGNTTSTTLEGE
jgi:PKD repeat protein